MADIATLQSALASMSDVRAAIKHLVEWVAVQVEAAKDAPPMEKTLADELRESADNLADAVIYSVPPEQLTKQEPAEPEPDPPEPEPEPEYHSKKPARKKK